MRYERGNFIRPLNNGRGTAADGLERADRTARVRKNVPDVGSNVSIICLTRQEIKEV